MANIKGAPKVHRYGAEFRLKAVKLVELAAHEEHHVSDVQGAPGRRASHPLDALRKAADHHAPLLENDAVRVLDTRVRPGERTPVHAHEWPAAHVVLRKRA